MTNWFCSVFNVVCVVNVCPVHAVDLELIDSAWVVVVPGQKCIKREDKIAILTVPNMLGTILFPVQTFNPRTIFQGHI